MESGKRSDEHSWARPVSRLETHDVPRGAIDGNIRGRRVSGATGGFGQLWAKSFRTRLRRDVTPEQVIATWKQRYAELWPKGQRMFLPQIAPGQIGIINASVPLAPTMATGVLVIYADDVSFSFMTPEGHPFTGIITFSAERGDDGVTVAQVQELVRASDPFWEVGMMTFIGQRQNAIWPTTLRNLAALFGASGEVETEIKVVDQRRQWRNARNIFYNAGIRSAMSAPLRWVRPRAKG